MSKQLTPSHQEGLRTKTQRRGRQKPSNAGWGACWEWGTGRGLLYEASGKKKQKTKKTDLLIFLCWEFCELEVEHWGSELTWSRKQSHVTKRRTSSVFNRIIHFFRVGLFCGNAGCAFFPVSLLSITHQLPWYSLKPKQYQALIIHIELYCTERVRQRVCCSVSWCWYRSAGGCVCLRFESKESIVFLLRITDFAAAVCETNIVRIALTNVRLLRQFCSQHVWQSGRRHPGKMTSTYCPGPVLEVVVLFTSRVNKCRNNDWDNVGMHSWTLDNNGLLSSQPSQS